MGLKFWEVELVFIQEMELGFFLRAEYGSGRLHVRLRAGQMSQRIG